MKDKPSKIDLNIYLAKADVKEIDDILKNPNALKSFDLELSGIDLCKLFIKNNFENTPRWCRFFNGHINIEKIGKNSSTGSLLILRKDNKIFILTFGQGFHLLDSAKIEMNFGLRTCLNSLDVASIRSIDKSSFEQHPTQSREQTGIATELQYFGINIDQDLLRAITGKPKNKEFGKRISGMDSLKLSVEVELNNISTLLENVLLAYNSDEYKQGAFAWVDHIGEVKDKCLHEKLDNILVDKIANGSLDRIWLSVPEIIDWDRVVGFKYSGAKKAPRYYDIRMPHFLDSLNGETVDIKKLNQRKIRCVDSDDYPVYEKTVYRYIYAEVTHESDVYILNNGKWYRVSNIFASQINEFFSNAPLYDQQLPEFNDETEGDYNERVANKEPDSFVLLDKKNIKIPGAASPVEPCDLLRNGNEFIHVKRYGGSSVLSHLFNQGLTSGELFQMDSEFRKLLNNKLPDNFKINDVDNRPKQGEYSVIFAIISESDEDSLSIPFFSKISLKHVLTRLQAIGFKVGITKIIVNERKKKTKKYAASK